MPNALIWGASGGIGRALVEHGKARGWSVYAAARDEGRIPQQADGGVYFDAADRHSFETAAYTLAQQADPFDLVVYAAGGMAAAPAAEFPAELWARVFDANLTGAQRAAAVSLPLMRDGGAGSALMFLGAHVDKLILPRFAAYAAAKAALDQYAAVLAKEQRKLRVTVVKPGAVDTPFWANVPFALPKGAAAAASVAEAVFAHYDAGGAGVLAL
jgi:NADP-dependent 3-hydroxy acid dehydrogenase YdfG